MESLRVRDVRSGGARGRILQVRRGINPNSSGYGILWGALFFLPYSLVALVVGAAVQRPLNRALSAFAGRSETGLRAAALGAFLWWLAFAGFTAAWVAFLQVLTILDLKGTWPYLIPAIAGVLAGLVPGLLAWLGRGSALVAQVTPRAALAALAGVPLLVFLYFFAGGLLWRQLSLPAGLLLVFLLYCSILALLLAASALKESGAAWSGRRIALFLLLYLVVGIITVFPYPPLISGSFNTVGLFMPLWGFGVPFAAAVICLARRLRRT